MLLYLILVVIIALQFITILIIVGNKKQGGGSLGNKRPNVVSSGENRQERKGADPRRSGSASGGKPVESRGGKPQQQGRPQQSQQAAAAPQEKTLRDINLRLKNAEREQDSARKKIQENGNARPDARPQQRGAVAGGNAGPGAGGRINRNGNDGPPRREFNRDVNHGANRDVNREMNREAGRDASREIRRDIRPERPNRGEHENMPPPHAGHDPAGAPFQERPRQFPQQRQPMPPPRFEQAVSMDRPPQPSGDAPGDFNPPEDRMQHGRRFTAKRRQLPENGADAPVQEEANVHLPPAPMAAVSANVPDMDVNANARFEQGHDGDGGDSDIQFGRR
ncbi:MAG: hypothetical protein LBC70_02170 [Chitinispirillales bacterium]|jgi:hypothetical protein|nr:hypothetical protein [Chitinispirillales bacterium]